MQNRLQIMPTYSTEIEAIAHAQNDHQFSYDMKEIEEIAHLSTNKKSSAIGRKIKRIARKRCYSLKADLPPGG
jgi:hypothetical protein